MKLLNSKTKMIELAKEYIYNSFNFFIINPFAIRREVENYIRSSGYQHATVGMVWVEPKLIKVTINFGKSIKTIEVNL